MPRPRHDSELLPAKERMRNAFWALLEDREYRKITVTDIVHEAQVNRNSFYYHYGSLSELADDAILQEVENTSIAQLVDETTDDHGIPSMDDDAVREHWHKRISAAIKLLRTPHTAQPHGASGRPAQLPRTDGLATRFHAYDPVHPR